MLDAAGFPVTSKGKTSILFEDRLDNHILQVLRIVGSFVVLFVEQDESVYFPPKFLLHVHHAVFLILVLLQRNQDVDYWSLNIFFIQREYPLSLCDAILEWSSSAILSYLIICSSVHPQSDKDFR